MKEKLELDFVLFDMIGTTVKDSKSGQSVILDSFKKAFDKNGIEVSYEAINQQRGKSKQIAIRNILGDLKSSLDVHKRIYKEFMNELEASILHFSEMPQSTQVFSTLKTKNIKLGIGSGLPLHFMILLMDHLSWNPDDFDYINSSDELSAGRPDPAMILDAVDSLQLKDKNRILKIGDTVVDVKEGKNAGVLTAMVLSGTQTAKHLGKIKPDFIWESIADLSDFV